MLILLFFVNSVFAGYECRRLEELQDEVQKHGFGFVAARRIDTDEEFQEYLDRRYENCKKETEVENEPQESPPDEVIESE